MKPRLLVICGPTATGKSDLAVMLAKKFSGEIISADSRQVYKGLNIGTGKITTKEMAGIPHYLLDVASPRTKFSVVNYVDKSEKAIDEIFRKNKTPILVGGTGFYIEALIDGVVLPDVPPDQKLRANLLRKTSVELVRMLTRLDPKRAAAIDPHNIRRLIRAIEIAKALGKVPKVKKHKPHFKPLIIGLNLESAELRSKIHTRLLKRLDQGMIEEVRKLHKAGLSWKRMNELGLEYRYVALFLQKKISKEEMVTKLETEIWHYAKRQITWFKRDKRIKWFSPANLTEMIQVCYDFLNEI
jgi:tRNA dimethylallyltransferase